MGYISSYSFPPDVHWGPCGSPGHHHIPYHGPPLPAGGVRGSRWGWHVCGQCRGVCAGLLQRQRLSSRYPSSIIFMFPTDILLIMLLQYLYLDNLFLNMYHNMKHVAKRYFFFKDQFVKSYMYLNTVKPRYNATHCYAQCRITSIFRKNRFFLLYLCYNNLTAVLIWDYVNSQ